MVVFFDLPLKWLSVKLKLGIFYGSLGSWSSLVWFCVWDAEVARSNLADPTTNHYLIIKSYRNTIAEQWRRVRVMTWYEVNLIALSSGTFLSILDWWDFVVFWKTRFSFDCRNYPCNDWIDSIYGSNVCSNYWNPFVFWNKGLCRKKKTYDWKRCGGRCLHGMWFYDSW